jgi:Domain of unknown function (DUF4249)
MRPGLILIIYLLLLSGCREPYQPPVILAQSNLLVVDAFLDGSDGSCTVVLSRSQDVSDTNEPPKEKKANVQLEDSEGNVYALKEVSDGNYSVSNITIDTQLKYQLSIKTEDGKKYQSDYVEIKKTPPIDTVTWEATGQGLQFYISTHDNEKKSIYYQYRFVETWAYVAPFPSNFEIKNGVAVTRSDDIYHCWATSPSTGISIATSVKLSEDIISNFPFYLIPKPSEKYLIRYSILVKQTVLTSEAYNYWQQLEKNTEKIGTLFDPQPSQIQSNIQNVDNENEPVLGYFSAGITTEKRIFVSFSELPPDWFFRDTQCKLDTVLNKDLGRGSGDLLISGLYHGSDLNPYGYLYTTTPCGDCRAAGGTTTKPDFW